jgi:ankyrin repeat protein
MSDALPLPPRPNLEHYKKRAKDLHKVYKSGDPEALRGWVAGWIEAIAKANQLGATPAQIGFLVQRTAKRITKHMSACTLARAQFAIAREHGFTSWARFVKHLQGLSQPDSPVAAFEAAVEAIVGGDLAKLKKLLRANSKLVRARSMRDHRSTLLHYVSANGVEDFRQKTPKNIVAIAKLLLEAGADVNAESDAYGGRSTTLGLAATSCHPEDAGVQLPLMDLLIDHGALIDGPDGGSAVNGCLHNGRGEAAEYLAAHGARLDLEAAAGVGRLDVVKSFFEADGRLKRTATPQQLQDGFAWACEFGRTAVVDFLPHHGVEVNTKLKHDGQTGLHWASYGGHADTVKLLLDRGAPVDVKDGNHDGTPLDWALYAWGNLSERGAGRGRYYETVALLARAGGKLDPRWYEDDVERARAAKKLHADPRMRAALRGEMASA